jgi:hypothetical protein
MKKADSGLLLPESGASDNLDFTSLFFSLSFSVYAHAICDSSCISHLYLLSRNIYVILLFLPKLTHESSVADRSVHVR